MNKKIYVVAVSICLLFLGCGKKGNPNPKSDLNLPIPNNVSLVMEKDGIRISNPSDEYKLSVERAEVALGDVVPPFYRRVAIIDYKSSWTDSGVKKNTRYSYKFKYYQQIYSAYSNEYIESISYKDDIFIKKIDYNIDGNKVCIKPIVSEDTARYEVILNGINYGQKECYTMPDTIKIIALIIPFSQDGSIGTAYSDTINRDIAKSLLPPQNIKIIKNRERVTLSWDKMPNITTYNIKIIHNNGEIENRRTDATIFSYNSIGCSVVEISSSKDSQKSNAVKISTCTDENPNE